VPPVPRVWGPGIAGNALNHTSLDYIYDAEGRRVGKTDGTVYTVDAGGAVLDEENGGTWRRSEVFLGGHHLATVNAAGVFFVHADWLGTERARTNAAGQICQIEASQPWGDNAQTSGSCEVSPEFLTGKPRDTESNLDDFGARYFSSQWGRWMSADWTASPSAVPYATITNPQSLNLYAYVGNDPVDGMDPDGHWMFPIPGNTCYSTATACLEAMNGQNDQNAVQAYHDSIVPASAFDRTSTGTAQQQNGTTTTPGDPSRLTQPNPDTVVPGSPSQQRDRVYQATDKDGNPITTPGAQIMENAKVTKISPGYQLDFQTSNGKWRDANPSPGQFTDYLGPNSRDKTATFSYTTRQTFQIKIGDTVYPLSTVVRNQITVVGGVVTSIKTTFITP